MEYQNDILKNGGNIAVTVLSKKVINFCMEKQCTFYCVFLTKQFQFYLCQFFMYHSDIWGVERYESGECNPLLFEAIESGMDK